MCLWSVGIRILRVIKGFGVRKIFGLGFRVQGLGCSVCRMFVGIWV